MTGRCAPRNLVGKSDHRATHVWDDDVCRWCAVRRSWPGASAQCRGGTAKNQAAVNTRPRVAKSIAKAKAARAEKTT